MRKPQADSQTRKKLLDAAEGLMLAKGYTATSVDDVCQAAGLTKGSFFHYFPGKEDLAIAVVQRFYAVRKQAFEEAPFRRLSDPLDRVFGYVDFLLAMVSACEAPAGCLMGTFTQELAQTHPNVRSACASCFEEMAAGLEQDLEQARAKHAPKATWGARGLAEHLLAVMQGAIVLAKAKQDGAVIVESLRHYRAYLSALFGK
jgi:TetR/AcrR family transcriptional repressor of nem operon